MYCICLHTHTQADLSGIKWKAYSAVDRPVPVGPLEDPVLSTYSKCLQSNILSVWRRVRHEDLNILDNSRPDGPPQWAKELWIFWYGEDPKFGELITYPELKGKSGLLLLPSSVTKIQESGSCDN